MEVNYLVWYFLPTAVMVPPLGLPANALVIRLLLGKPGICSTSEIFFLNLALFDMLFCLFFLVEFVLFVCDPTMAASNFVVWGLNQAGGPLLLCLMGLDSYMAVCHPLVFLRLKDPKLRLSACSVVCVVGAVACCLVKFSAKLKWYVISGILCGATAIMTTCNILILRSLRQLGPGRKEVHPVKKRAFKTVLTASVLVNVHYLPPVGEYLLRQFGPSQFKPFSFLTCVAWIALSTASFVQPLCYLVRTGQLPKLRCDRGDGLKRPDPRET
ncbi:hypothetical protein VZT92_003360 [Zoarces viviparus]|uniref:G-protein coupled receptors family 1 profile domain-containing protein n=1 Tax=Zoarces viviparus TaxID=48416 RepID=A0AAW1G287_ZOAVI